MKYFEINIFKIVYPSENILLSVMIIIATVLLRSRATHYCDNFFGGCLLNRIQSD